MWLFLSPSIKLASIEDGEKEDRVEIIWQQYYFSAILICKLRQLPSVDHQILSFQITASEHLCFQMSI